MIRRAMVLAALALASCNAAAPPAMTCGPDTHAVNGQCVVDDGARTYLDGRMPRARAFLTRDGMLDDLGRLRRAERLALDPAIATALTSPPGEIARAASVAFARLKADEPGPAPDVIALVDATGQVVAMDGVANPVAGRWSDGKGGTTWPSLAVALQRSIAIAEPRVDGERGLMRFGIGAVLAPGSETVIGAVVIGDAVTEAAARAAALATGTEVAFVDGEKVFASSPRANPGDAAEIARSLAGAGDGPRAVTVAGRAYAAIAVPLPRMTNHGLVSELAPPTARAVLFAETSAPAPKP